MLALSGNMSRFAFCLGAVSAAVVWLGSAPARAASLEQVTDWVGDGVPADVSMYIYVPDEVAPNPPLVVVSHFCGGVAGEVFGQAQGGGLVSAADEYGFIMVLPSSDRCWDVVSDRTWTRGGGGDSDAIAQMVSYALETYDANPDRVYATGDSSGGMMTELLLALYPDVFKAGSAMAGMPAGCRGAAEPSDGNGYSGACAGGSVTRTPEEWGDIARGMAPGYEGHRPRVQLFHGDADDLIRPENHTEAIKQWTDVLGLGPDPDTTETVQLGNHQATRQQWRNECGVVVLDAFLSLGGDHGPSDALFLAEYLVPFLGLDHVGPLDPEIEQCGDPASGQGGAAGVGGASGQAGSAAVGGTSAAGAAGADPAGPPGSAGSGDPGPAGMGGMPGSPEAPNPADGAAGAAPSAPSPEPTAVAPGEPAPLPQPTPAASPSPAVTSSGPVPSSGTPPPASSSSAPAVTPEASKASSEGGGCATGTRANVGRSLHASWCGLLLLAASFVRRRRRVTCRG